MSRTDGDGSDVPRSATGEAVPDDADDWGHRHAHVDPPGIDGLVRMDSPDDDWRARHGRTVQRD